MFLIFYFWPVMGLGCGACGLLIVVASSLVGKHCRVLVPPPGFEPTFRALQIGFLTTGPPGEFLSFVFNINELWGMELT